MGLNKHVVLGLKNLNLVVINLLQFQDSIGDSCLFIQQSNGCSVFLLVYVDGNVVTSSYSYAILDVIHSINNETKLKDLGGLNYFLNIEVTTTDNYLLLNQKKYIQEIIEKLGLTEASSFPTPMTDPFLTKIGMSTCTEPFEDETLFRSNINIGALQHVCITMPDIHFWSTNSVSICRNQALVTGKLFCILFDT